MVRFSKWRHRFHIKKHHHQSNRQWQSSAGGNGKSNWVGNGKNDMVNVLRVQIEMHELEKQDSPFRDQP